MPLSDARILVFARPLIEPPPVDCLEARVSRFLETGPDSEPIDKVLHGRSPIGKIADYLIDQRQLVVELKTIRGDPSERVTSLVKETMKQEPRMFAFGRVGVAQLLRQRSNGDEVNRQMVEISGRAVRQQLQRADRQISATRQQFNIPKATGLVVLTLDKGSTIEASLVANAVRQALTGEELPLRAIDYVWATMENHTIRMPNGGLGYPEMLMWRDAEYPKRTQALLGNMLDAWAASHQLELVPIDHTASWETLRPFGDGWPLNLSLGS